MKKKSIIAIILVFVMISAMTTNAFADDFTLRNDIHFGDSKNEVKEKETFDLKTEESDTLIYTGTFGDYETELSFIFNDDKLTDMKYVFRFADGGGYSQIKDIGMDLFSDLKETLSEKYGEQKKLPTDSLVENDVKTIKDNDGYSFSMDYYKQMASNVWGTASNAKDIYSWVSDNEVSIDLLAYKYVVSLYGTLFGVKDVGLADRIERTIEVLYHELTEEETYNLVNEEEIKAEKEAEEAARLAQEQAAAEEKVENYKASLNSGF